MQNEKENKEESNKGNRTRDLPLNPEGVRKVVSLAGRLDSGDPVEIIYSGVEGSQTLTLTVEDEPIADVREILIRITAAGSELIIRRHTQDGDVGEWNDFITPNIALYAKARKVV
jgi:broad specificity phosphatase PhoE